MTQTEWVELKQATNDESISVQALPARRGEPAVILGGLQTTACLNDLLDQGFAGACLSEAYTREVRAKLRQAIARGGLQGQETYWSKRELHQVLHAFNHVQATKAATLYVSTSAQAGHGHPEALNR